MFARVYICVCVQAAPVINIEPYTQEIWMTDEDLIELRHQVTLPAWGCLAGRVYR